MTRRQIALTHIIADVRDNGKLTKFGIRAYVENRISPAALREAMETGMKLRKRIAAAKTTEGDPK